MAVSESQSNSSSIFCSCCPFGSFKKKSTNYQNHEIEICPISLDSTTVANPTNSTELVPKILVKNRDISENLMESTTEDVFTTARTSRVDETQKYTSMSELIQKIRSEAGFNDTPRISEKSEVVISQLRIEGLAEIERNQDVPISLPSVSAAYSTSETEIIQFPDEQTVKNYHPSMRRRFGEITFLAFNTFWKTYSIIITFIALILERILPV